MGKIDQLRKLWAQADCILEIFNAPSDAQTFDKMLVIFVDEMRDLQTLAGIQGNKTSGKRIIRRVSLYNSKTDQIVAEY